MLLGEFGAMPPVLWPPLQVKQQQEGAAGDGEQRQAGAKAGGGEIDPAAGPEAVQPQRPASPQIEKPIEVCVCGGGGGKGGRLLLSPGVLLLSARPPSAASLGQGSHWGSWAKLRQLRCRLLS